MFRILAFVLWWHFFTKKKMVVGKFLVLTSDFFLLYFSWLNILHLVVGVSPFVPVL